MGGLGIRGVTLLAPSAFLASAAGSQLLQGRILAQPHWPLDNEIERIQASWSSLTSTNRPQGESTHKQKKWDEIITLGQFNNLLEKQTDIVEQARLKAVSAPHSGDWLTTLPISACGLRMDNEAIRVAVGLRLGALICEPHKCICEAAVDAKGLHSLSCKKSRGRMSRHQYLNDVIWRAVVRAGVPAIKEPAGLLRTDGKRPDGLTQIPWEEGRCVTWDVTVTDTLAASNLSMTSSTAGAAAENAAAKKVAKYAELSFAYTFVPIAFETFGPVNSSGEDFVNEIGKRIRAITGDVREVQFLWQRLSIAVQRYNAVCLNGTFMALQEAW